MALVNVFYGMAIISFFVTMMFCVGSLVGELTGHPIKRFCSTMAEDAGVTCLIFVALTVVGLLFM